MEQVLEFYSTKRFYVFFADGTWRTCEDGLWKAEQLWKLKPIYTCWAGGEHEAKVLKAIIERFNLP